MGSGAYRIVVDAKALEELSHRVPDFPRGWFVRAVSAYLDARNNPDPTPKTIRDELDVIAAQAISLAERLSSRSDALSDYLELREAKHGAIGLTSRLVKDLENLMGIAEMARRDAEKQATAGRKISARTELVAQLAGALEHVNLPVTAKAQDRLVLAFGIALDAVGETVADAAKTVASALRTIEAKQ